MERVKKQLILMQKLIVSYFLSILHLIHLLNVRLILTRLP